MPRVNLIDRKTKLGVKALRVAMGGKGHRPSAYNACIGAAMKTPAPSAPTGAAGLRNVALQRNFVQAAIKCGANVSAATRRKFGL